MKPTKDQLPNYLSPKWVKK